MTNKTPKTLSTVLAITLLGACSSTTENIIVSGPGTQSLTNLAPGTATETNGIFAAQSGATTITLPTTNVNLNGQKAWIDSTNRARSYLSPTVTAVGGIQNDTLFSGISGTLRSIPSTGTATYTGQISAYTNLTATSGPITLTADYANGTLTGASTSTTVTGTITGNTLSGTVGFDNKSAPMTGGFYGTDEVAGAFSGDDIAGIFYATE